MPVAPPLRLLARALAGASLILTAVVLPAQAQAQAQAQAAPAAAATCGTSTTGTGCTGQSNTPNFGPNVYVFDPSMSSSSIQATLDNVFNTQKLNQFGTQRYALLFKPGSASPPSSRPAA